MSLFVDAQSNLEYGDSVRKLPAILCSSTSQRESVLRGDDS